jgi:hypothetical protein
VESAAKHPPHSLETASLAGFVHFLNAVLQNRQFWKSGWSPYQIETMSYRLIYVLDKKDRLPASQQVLLFNTIQQWMNVFPQSALRFDQKYELFYTLVTEGSENEVNTGLIASALLIFCHLPSTSNHPTLITKLTERCYIQQDSNVLQSMIHCLVVLGSEHRPYEDCCAISNVISSVLDRDGLLKRSVIGILVSNPDCWTWIPNSLPIFFKLVQLSKDPFWAIRQGIAQVFGNLPFSKWQSTIDFSQSLLRVKRIRNFNVECISCRSRIRWAWRRITSKSRRIPWFNCSLMNMPKYAMQQLKG